MRALIISILTICPILFKPRIMYAASYDDECIEFLEVMEIGFKRNGIIAATDYQASPVRATFYTDSWAITVSETVPPPPPKDIYLRILGTCKHVDKVFVVAYVKKLERM